MRHDGLFACHVAFFVNDSQGNVWRGGGGRKVFVYICKGVRRWAGAAGDLSLNEWLLNQRGSSCIFKVFCVSIISRDRITDDSF